MHLPSLVMSLVASFCAVLFPLDVLGVIWDFIESVSEGFPTYFCYSVQSDNVYHTELVVLISSSFERFDFWAFCIYCYHYTRSDSLHYSKTRLANKRYLRRYRIQKTNMSHPIW